MKNAFLTSVVLVSSAASSLAADLPSRIAAPAPAPITLSTNWTGCYVGIGSGYTSLRNSSPLAAGLYDGGKNTANSANASARIGCDYEINRVVIGAYGAFDRTFLSGRNDFYPVGPGFPEYLTTKASWIASAGLRLGYLVTPEVLAYVKGGAAWTRLKLSDYDVNPVTSFVGRASASRNGWNIGGGFEYALTSNWSVFAEYNLINFGTKTTTLYDGVVYQGGPWDNRYTNKAHMVSIGVQYKFK